MEEYSIKTVRIFITESMRTTNILYIKIQHDNIKYIFKKNIQRSCNLTSLTVNGSASKINDGFVRIRKFNFKSFPQSYYATELSTDKTTLKAIISF